MIVACLFFFSSRRRHTRYWRDWSSDVCSSDLVSVGTRRARRGCRWRQGRASGRDPQGCRNGAARRGPHRGAATGAAGPDRKSVGVGKRVDFGGRRFIKKKTKRQHLARPKKQSV